MAFGAKPLADDGWIFRGQGLELQYSLRMMLTFSITGLEVFMMFQNCFMNSLYHFGNSRNSWQTGFVARAGMLVHSCWRPWRRILSGVEPRSRGRSHCEGFPGDSPRCIGPKWNLGRLGERSGARPRDRPVDTEARSGAWASMLLQPKSVLSDIECMPVQYMIWLPQFAMWNGSCRSQMYGNVPILSLHLLFDTFRQCETRVSKKVSS